jgi:hypothetical protein
MKDLKVLCKNWGDIDCHPNVSKWRYAKPLKEGEAIPIMPVGEEQKRLDAICEKCESRFFIMDEERCPVCDSIDVERTGGSHNMPGMATAYGFKCNDCEEKFWIYE